MKNTPKVSVIIPVYNAEKYLKKCLDTVIGQTLEDIEVLVVDDGSSDGSWKIIQEYAKNEDRIIAIKQENEGAAVARNKGLERASGEYIGFVDSDDYVDSDYFEQLYKTAKASNSDIARAYVKAENIGTTLHSQEVLRSKEAYENMYNVEGRAVVERNKLNLRNVIWLSIYRRSLLENNGIVFYPELRTGQDSVFNTEVSYFANRVTYVDIPVYYRRVVRDGSLMTEFNFTEKGLLSRSMVLRRTIDFLNSKKDYDREVYAIRAADGFVFLQSRIQYARNRRFIRSLSETIAEAWQDVKYKDDVYALLNGIDAEFVAALNSQTEIYELIYHRTHPQSRRILLIKQFVKKAIKTILPYGIVVLYGRRNKQ